MNRADALSYWDLRTVRLILMLAHGSFAVLTLVLRPFLFEIVHGYAGMAALMPTRYWGLCAVLVVVGILSTRHRPGLQVLAHLASGMLLSVLVVAVTATVGPNLSTLAYVLFGGMSLWAFYRVFSIWLEGRASFQSARRWIQEHRRV